MQTGIARAARCPCGSGRRYKDCHGALAGTGAPPAWSLPALERTLADAPAQPRVWKLALDTYIGAGAAAADAEVGSAFSLGDARPLRVAVVTPYAREDVAMLRRCHDSVASQTYACRHFMVADGFARDELDSWPIEHLRLAQTHGDFGDAPRAAGGEAAAAAGFDAVAYLDADNSFRPRHIESLVCRQQGTGAAIVYAGRTLHLPDGHLVPGLMADDGVDHIDTSCYLFARAAFGLLSAWTAYPRAFAMICDRMIMQMLRARGIAPRCTGALTVRYMVNEARFFHISGRPVPADVRPDYDFTPLRDWYRRTDPGERAAVSARLGFSVEDFLRGYLVPQGVTL